MASPGITVRLHKFSNTISCADHVQPYLGQNYLELKQECLRRKCLFIDPTFEASPKSLGYKKWAPDTLASKRLTWKRPTEICKHGTPRFINEGMTRHDIRQQDLGDCWYMAATASLTLYPELLHRVVHPDQSFAEEEYAGIFHFQFWQYGQWVDVVVDDLLPTEDGQLKFAVWNESDDFWVPLLEKAYAKLNGSYEAIEGGLMNEAFVDFTGGIGEIIDLKSNKPKLFKTMEMALTRKSLLGASILELKDATAKGLSEEHAYSITGIHKLNIDGEKVKLVRLRNPWGKDEWKGRWNDSSEMWLKLDPELQKKLHVDKVDGEFWMELGDFKQNFQQLDICHLSVDRLNKEGDQFFWSTNCYHGRWSKGTTAGGSLKYNLQESNTFWNNPRYLVSLREPDKAQWDPKGKKHQKSSCTLIVSLMQKNRRRGKPWGKNLLDLSFYIFQVPKEVTKQDLQRMTITKRKELFSTFTCVSEKHGRNLRDITSCCQLSPGNYLIIPCTTSPQDEAEFLLRIFTETKHKCLELDDENSADEKTLHVRTPPKTGVNRMMDITFLQYAGQNKKMGIAEFKNFLNSIFISGRKPQTEGFSMEDCQKIVQHFDGSGTGKLTLDAFKQCWATINEWANIFMNYDADSSGTMDAYELRDALEAAGFHLNHQTIELLLKKYSNPLFQICFDKFVFVLVRLERLFRLIKSWDDSSIGKYHMSEKEWMDLLKS